MEAFVLDEDKVVRTQSFDDVRAAHAAGKTVWVDLKGHSPEAQALLEEAFHVHPLAIEDVWGDLESPKAEDFGAYVQVLVHSVRHGKSAADMSLLELDVLVSRTWIVTYAKDVALTAHVAKELERSPRILKKGPAWIAHAVLDRVVDDYLPLIDAFDEEISELEGDCVDKAGTPAGRKLLGRIFALKRALQHLRRVSVRQREILLRLARAEFDEIPADAGPFFRDVYDHFARVTDLADSYRELLSGALEAYLSVQSNRMNEVMKTLTLISTVMLPLTFVAGVYGMNFEHMPELKWDYGYVFALVLMASIAGGIILYFRHKRWL
jgi:magnesium transporter